MRFSIRDVLLVTVFVAICAAWWVDRTKLAEEIRRLKMPRLPYYTMGPAPDVLSPKYQVPAPNPLNP